MEDDPLRDERPEPDRIERPSDRLTEDVVSTLIASAPFLGRRLRVARVLERGSRWFRWCARLVLRALAFFIEWWPKLWKTLILVPPLLVSLEQMGIPVLSTPRMWIEAFVAGGAPE